MRIVAVERAEPGPELPAYQPTVLADPFTSDVALPSGEPETRSGGWAGVKGPAPAKPRALNPAAGPVAAAFELVMDRLAALSVWSVMTPPETVDGVEVPVIESIFFKSVWTLSVTLIWLPVAPEATNVNFVPLTVMESPATKPVVSVSEPAGNPDSVVVPLTYPCGGPATWFCLTVPVSVPSVLKKLSPASTADAATSEVLASVPIAVFRAVFRLAAVAATLAAGVASVVDMAKLLA